MHAIKPRRRRPSRALLAALAPIAAVLLFACGDADLAATSAFRHRGVIEGFYGRPYTTAERVRLVAFVGERGMNAYVYAPKNDPKHRDEWRAPYAAEELAGFAELAAAGEAAGVRIYFAISPGITYRAGDPEDFRLLAEKLASVHATGVRGFALLFDDILDQDADAVQQPGFQAELTARVAEVVDGFGDGSDLWFIGHLYAGTAQQFADATIDPGFLTPHPPSAYYDAYAAIVPGAIPILWTGPKVISRALRRDEAAAFRELARRPVVVWDNFPVNDVFGSDLFLGPYVGRDRDLDEAIEGIVLNLMTQPTAGLVAVATAADYMRDPRGYDPERSWRDAVAAVGGGDDAATLERFAALHRGHPMLEGAVEAPELAARIAAAFAAGAGESDRSALRDSLSDVARLEADVAGIADRTLAAEIGPWAAKASALARAGLAGLDALEGAGSADAYGAARAAALRLPQHVAKDHVSPVLLALFGPGNEVDRFSDLFAAIEAGLR